MAKDREPGDMVTIPRSEWDRLQAAITELLLDKRVREERGDDFHAKEVLDRQREQRINSITRSCAERTQEIANKTYGTEGQRWRCYMDSTTEDGKPGPDVSIFFPLELSANSDLEAQARYQSIMGIRKHDYRIVAAKVQPASAA